MRKVTLDDAKKFHDQFYGANYGVFAIVGPVDQKAVTGGGGGTTRQLEHRHGIQADRRGVQSWRRRSIGRSKLPTKPTRSSKPGVRFKLSENDPDYPAMLLAGYMFGGPITSRVSDRIRNREGLSYGANARITVPSGRRFRHALRHGELESGERPEGGSSASRTSWRRR